HRVRRRGGARQVPAQGVQAWSRVAHDVHGEEGVRARPSNGDRSLAETAYTSLRQAIHTGRYRPGDRMREAELALWLGISRTPVRDALKKLEGDGLVSAAPRRGLVVTQLEQEQVSELYAVR